MADRRNKTVRDMTISMGVIVVVVLLLVGFDGGFSFSPGKPSGGGVQTADVHGGFDTADRASGFTVVVPKGLPAAWHGSSFSITRPPGTAAAPPAVRGGWLTPSGAYIALVEFSGAPAAVLGAELGQTTGTTTGSITAAGAIWTVGNGVRNEAAWWRTENGVTLLITGSAAPAEFSVLANAVGS